MTSMVDRDDGGGREDCIGHRRIGKNEKYCFGIFFQKRLLVFNDQLLCFTPLPAAIQATPVGNTRILDLCHTSLFTPFLCFVVCVMTTVARRSRAWQAKSDMSITAEEVLSIEEDQRAVMHEIWKECERHIQQSPMARLKGQLRSEKLHISMNRCMPYVEPHQMKAICDAIREHIASMTSTSRTYADIAVKKPGDWQQLMSEWTIVGEFPGLFEPSVCTLVIKHYEGLHYVSMTPGKLVGSPAYSELEMELFFVIMMIMIASYGLIGVERKILAQIGWDSGPSRESIRHFMHGVISTYCLWSTMCFRTVFDSV